MDLQARKLAFIEDFIRLQSEEAILKLEKLLKREKKTIEEDRFKPMSIEEFHKRIDTSMEDFKNGRVISQEDLLSEIKKWG